MKVLIIDDDLIDRKAIERNLNKANQNIQITEAYSGKEALSLISQTEFDVIMIDYLLPDMDGFEIVKEIRSSKVHSTIIMLSHHEDEELALKAIEAGAQDFILKEELSTKRLLRAVKQAQHRFDIEEKQNQSLTELRRLAGYDPLTGLANRYIFEIELHKAFATAKRNKRQLAVLILDLDKFKKINDVHGHASGDALLVEIARRLSRVVRETDLIARLGGDEFVILAQEMARKDQTQLLANRIISVLDEPISLEQIKLNITTSIGIANLNQQINKPGDLLKCADIAMYRAKEEGRNQCHFYSKQLHEIASRRRKLEYDITQAIERCQLKIYYQGQFNTRDGQLNGMEALLRWDHPDFGLILPDQFLSIANETGEIVSIGEWVMRNACKQLKKWLEQLPERQQKLTMSVNLSTEQLRDENLVSMIRKCLADTLLPPHLLDLEITENSIIKEPENAAEILKEITLLGVRIALDDFGTGFSSFQHLKLFPVQTMKIDRMFMSGIGHDAFCEQLLAAIVGFAQALNIQTVAEGIETEEQHNFCRKLNCDAVQGFYCAKPLPAEEFETLFLTGAVH